MASTAKRRAENVAGPFYVDETCIDCDTCRWMAPETYHRDGGMSAVHHQPDSDEAGERALRALVACPTASIGTDPADPRLGDVAKGFPVSWGDGVSHCGYHSRSSFGAASWLLAHPDGNIMVDSPRFAGPLVAGLEAQGGIAKLLLTHQDDVADHDRFHDHFGCDRVIHQDDKHIAAETVLTGHDATPVAEGLTAIPVPGHTKGSVVYHYDDGVGGALFTGDHLCWNPRQERLHAFRGACWYDWDAQIDSMKRLEAWAFTRVFPGHGPPVALPPERMRLALGDCIDWMASVR